MANPAIWPGSSSFATGSTPFGFYDTDAEFQVDADKVSNFCARRLGYPLVDVELQDISFYAAFEEAVTTYGNELYAYKIRDNQLMNTESGSAFMSGFNELYYSFSPTIADMERESPVFKEIVKAGLTPMLSTLTIMESAETESEVLGLGLSVIALNLGMYIGLPAFGIVKVIQLRKN